MHRWLPLIALVLVLSLSPHAITGDAADTSKKLQGTWIISELVVGGKPVPEKDIKGLKFVFAADKLTILPPSPDLSVVEKRLFSVKLDATKQPVTVDLTALDGENKGTVSPGILEIQGEVLRWCQSDDPKNTERPKTFASPEKSSYYLFTFKRGK